MIPRIEAPALLALSGIRHGYFTRDGGVSTGIYGSLNCGIGSNDDRPLILENRARVARAVGAKPDRLVTPYQVHGIDVVAVDTVWEHGKGPKADGVVTDKPGIALGVGTADCGPILFADAEARVIGAAHSGWRGALAGVGEATIAAMEKLGARPDRIVAVLGPTISQANYEVGTQVQQQFVANDARNARFFKPSNRPDHFLFDLPGVIVTRLTAAGISTSAIGLCTYADPERFFSFRRTTHLGQPDYGRLLSAIVLV